MSLFSSSQFNVDLVQLIQFNNNVDVPKFINYVQIQFSYKAEDNSVIIKLNSIHQQHANIKC